MDIILVKILVSIAQYAKIPKKPPHFIALLPILLHSLMLFSLNTRQYNKLMIL